MTGPLRGFLLVLFAVTLAAGPARHGGEARAETQAESRKVDQTEAQAKSQRVSLAEAQRGDRGEAQRRAQGTSQPEAEKESRRGTRAGVLERLASGQSVPAEVLVEASRGLRSHPAKVQDPGPELRASLEALARGEGSGSRQGQEALEAWPLVLEEDLRQAEQTLRELGLEDRLRERLEAARLRFESARSSLSAALAAPPETRRALASDLLKQLDSSEGAAGADRPILRASGLPYSPVDLPQRVPTAEPGIVPSYADPAAGVPGAGALASTPEAPLVDEILLKAEELGHDPVRLYDFVHDGIETQWYGGLMKGALGTLRQRAGNDADQAALLAALLRASGVPCHLVTGVMDLPLARFESQLGLSEPAAVSAFLTRAGVAHEPSIAGGAVTGFLVESVWVAAYVPYANYRGAVVDVSGKTWLPLAPALKSYEREAPTGALRAMELDVDAFLEEYRSTVQEAAPLDLLRSQVEAYLQQQGGGQSFEEQLGSRRIVPRPLDLLPSTLPVEVTAVTAEGPRAQATLVHRVRFLLRSGVAESDSPVLDVTLPLHELAGERLTLSYTPATDDDHRLVLRYGGLQHVPAYLVRVRPQLLRNGRILAVGEGSIELGLAHRWEMEMISPAGRGEVSQAVIAGSYHALALGAQRFAWHGGVEAEAGDGEYLAARLLAARAYDYGKRWDESEEVLAGLLDVAVPRPLPALVVASTAVDPVYVLNLRRRLRWEGVTLDAAWRTAEAIDRGDPEAPRDWRRLAALQGSSLEHRIFEEAFLVDSLSADKALGLARDLGMEVLELAAGDGPLLASTTHPAAIKQEIDGWLRSGFTVELPRHPVLLNAWVGSPWRVEDPVTGAAGYFLSGGLAGGVTTEAPGTWALAFLEDALSAPLDPAPNADPLAAARITKVAGGDGQEGEVGLLFTDSLAVRVTDEAGRPVQGAAVTFAAVRGGGLLSVPGRTDAPELTVPTDSQGLATVWLRSGERTSANPAYLLEDPLDEHVAQVLHNLVEAAVETRFGPAFIGAPFELFAFPGEPDELRRTDTSETVLDGYAGLWSDTLRLSVEDKFGNPVANVPVSVSTGWLGGTLDCPLVTPPIEVQEPGVFDAALGPDGSVLACPDRPITSQSCGSRTVVVESSTFGRAFAGVIPGPSTFVTYQVQASVSNVDPLHWQYTPKLTEGLPDPCDVPADRRHRLLFQGFVGNGSGENVSAARPGEEYRRPLEVSVVTFQDDYELQFDAASSAWRAWEFLRSTEGGWYPAAITSADQVQVEATQGATLSPVQEVGPGRFRTSVTTGPQPGIHELTASVTGVPLLDWCADPADGDPVELIDCRDGCFGDPILCPVSTVTSAPARVYGLVPQILALDPPEIVLTSEGRTAAPVTVGYQVAPASFPRVETIVELLEDGQPAGFAVGTASAGPGEAVLDRGIELFLERSYDLQLVVNPGSVAEVRSPAVALPVAQQIFRDVPPALTVSRDVDLVNRRVCTQPASFSFSTNQEATLTLTLRKVEALNPDGSPVLGDEAVLLDSELRPAGEQIVNVSPEDLPVGDYRFELRGVSAADGHEEVREGRALSELRSRDVLPVGHVLVKGVDLFDGHLVVSREDFRVPGRGVPLSFRRTYSSTSGFDPGDLGIGWVHEWESRIVINPCGEVIVIGGEGSGMRFVGDGSGGFQPLRGYHGSLFADPATNTFDFYSKGGNRWRYISDGQGGWRLAEAQDPEGNTTTVSYVVLGDGKPHVDTVTDSSGRVLRFAYEYREFPLWEGPVLTSVTGPGGLASRFTYGAEGYLQEARREEDAQVERYAYELVAGSAFPLQRYLKSTVNGLDGGTTRFEMAAASMPVNADLALPTVQVTSLREPEGGVTGFAFSPGAATVTDRRGFDIAYTFDSYGSPLTIRDPLGHTTTMEWPPDDVVMTRQVDANGAETAFTYDDAGNLLSKSIEVQDADGGAGTVTESSAYWRTTVRSGPGEPEVCFVTGLPPNPECPAVSATIKERIRSRTDAKGATTEFFYDAQGNLTEERIEIENAEGRRETLTTRHTYAPNGDRLSTENGRGHVTTFRYGLYGNLQRATDPLSHETTMVWDERSRLISRTDPRGNVTTFDYDALGRKTRTSHPVVGTVAAVETFQYDDVNNTQTYVDAEGRTTVNQLDLEGRVLRIENAAGGAKEYGYDPEGNVVQESSWYDASTPRFETAFTYDVAGRLATKTEPEGRRMVFEHDPVGNRIRETLEDTASSTSFLPRITEWSYDELRRVISERRQGDGLVVERRLYYDGVGNQTRARDPLGRETAYRYDALDRLIETTEPLDRINRTFYDAVGNKTREIALNRVDGVPAAQERAYSYDAANRLRSSTDAEGAVTSFEHDPAGNLLRRINPLGDVESYGYDARNRRTETVQHLERVTVPARTVTTGMSYDRVGNVVEERLANGNVLAHSYDALDRRTATSDLLGLVSEATYYARGNPVSSRDAHGRETLSVFDGLDRVVQLQQPEGRTTSFAYDVSGNKVSETDPRGQTSTFAYDRLNRLVQETAPAPFSYEVLYAYDAVGNLLSRTDARGHTTTLQYDALDRQVQESAPAPLSYVTTSEYDLVGNVVRQTDRRGIVSEMEYDRENRLLRRRRAGVLLEEHLYDGVGNAIQSWDANRNLVEWSFDERGLVLEENRPLGAVTTFRYDDAGDRVEEVDPEGRRETFVFDLRRRVTTRTNGAGESTEYEYDGVGNRILRRRPLGGEWLYGYDGADRLTSVEDPLGNRTEYGYDGNGNRTSTTDAAGKLTQMSYDELNRLSSMTYADGAAETYGYDAAGNRISKTDALGREKVYAYDELNRQTSRTYAAGSELTSITFAYDPSGNLIQAVESYASAPSAVTTQGWDDFDRLETRTDRYGRILTYAYDANGSRTRLIDPEGVSTNYTYDALNRVESVTPAGQGPTLYSWLKNGLLQEINYPNGVQSTNTYDLANRIETITNTLGPASISSLAYAYDGNGNRSEQTESQGGEVETTTYAYDTADRLVGVSYPESSVSYVYDSVGNRLEEREENSLGDPLAERSYTYDDRHRLEAITDLVDPDQSIAYTYDANGNQTSRAVGSEESLSFLYDPRDRLEEVQRDGLLLERYAYDYQGLRVRKAGPAGVEQTTLDDGEPFWRTDGQGLRTATYHWGPDRLLALNSAQEGLAYYLQDALGSPTHLVTPEGKLQARQQLDVWGNPRGTSSFDTANNPFGFTGYEKDSTTELLYAKARYYDPKIGRFLTRDPFQGSPQTPPSLHKYLYAHANPTVYVDPTGQCVLGLPCPELVRDTADVIRASSSAVFETSATLAGGLAHGVVASVDHLTLGSISSIGTRFGTLAGTRGSLSDRLEAARVEGNRQMLETATFGFSTAEDKGAHARQLVGEAFAVDSFKQGSTLLAEGLVEGDFDKGLRGAAALAGAAGQVTLTVAGAAETPLRLRASPRRPGAVVEDVAGPGMREGSLAAVGRSPRSQSSTLAHRGGDGLPVIRPGDRLPDGRIAGDGPGAALKGGPDFDESVERLGLFAYHGTDVESAVVFLRGGELDSTAAAARKIDGPPGFYVATDWYEAEFFALRRRGGAVLEVYFSDRALNDLSSTGLVRQQIPPGKWATFEGDEIMIPVEGFDTFNSLLRAGEITFRPSQAP